MAIPIGNRTNTRTIVQPPRRAPRPGAKTLPQLSKTPTSSNAYTYPTLTDPVVAPTPENLAPGTEGLHPTFASIVSQILLESGGAVTLTSGFRTRQQQQELYDLYKAGKGNLAARPGSSRHEHGLAVDLGGDLGLAAKLADKYGLVATVPGEPWHFELGPSLTDQVEDSWYTEDLGLNFDPATAESPEEALINRLNLFASILGMDPTIDVPDIDVPQNARMNAEAERSMEVQFPDSFAGSSDLKRFMSALKTMESGGNYTITGPQTAYGTAKGAYQFIDSTWDNYKGYPNAAAAPPHVQDERAAQLMTQYYNKYGSWELVATAWHGGPGAADRALKSGLITGRDVNMSTQNYVNNIMTLMNRVGG